MREQKQELEKVEEKIIQAYSTYHKALATDERVAPLFKQHYEVLTNKRNRLVNLELVRIFEGEKTLPEFLAEIVDASNNNASKQWLKAQEDTVLMLTIFAANRLFREAARELQERYGEGFFQEEQLTSYVLSN
ncbi:hypothetical protein [Aneurinibacillus tyrosinisolvens]|uniref:hypothetical protein n=1 Tax=Aneurinibacillus tyrosinisolvens TaxID=1443435 RepID=UPI00063F6E18|nr:hypothetical protein [Aneurinibacillus tyrosinisolvens]